MINKPEEYILAEWEEMYGRAKSQLGGTCPLLEDAVIIDIYEYMKKLEEEVNKCQT